MANAQVLNNDGCLLGVPRALAVAHVSYLQHNKSMVGDNLTMVMEIFMISILWFYCDPFWRYMSSCLQEVWAAAHLAVVVKPGASGSPVLECSMAVRHMLLMAAWHSFRRGRARRRDHAPQ